MKYQLIKFVCTGRNKLFQIIDGSFFVPYASCLSKARLYCLSVWNDVKDLYCPSFHIALPRCFPKASAKVMQLFKMTNKTRRKITLFFKLF